MKKIVLLLTLLLLVACGNKEKEVSKVEVETESILRFNLGVDPKSIEPAVNSALDGGHIINNTFEGLTRLKDGRVEPAMAESWDVSEDGKTYTFHLRDSGWSDGKPVSAYDFEYAWRRAMDPMFASEYAHHTFYIKGAKEYYEGRGRIEDVGIEVIDNKTLKVELVGSIPYFLDIASRHNFMPVREDIASKEPERWAKDPSIAVSNGPFLLSEYNIGRNIVLRKNPNYWDKYNVKLDKVDISMIVESTTALTAYQNNEVDIITQIPSQEIPKLMLEDNTFYIEPKVGTYYYIFNNAKAPFDNVDVRRAMSLAIDRKAITEQITKGGQIPATGFVPSSLIDSKGENFRQKSGNYEIDVDKPNFDLAREYLAKAGYKGGEGFPKATLLYNTSEGHKAVAEAVQAMWKKELGIDVQLMNQEWAVFQDTRHIGNYNIARAGWIGDYSDPMTFLDLWTSYSGNNDAQWKWTKDATKHADNKEFDEAIELSKVKSGKERDALMHRAEDLVMENMITMPIYYYTGTVMVKDRVQGWERDILGTWYLGRAEIVD